MGRRGGGGGIGVGRGGGNRSGERGGDPNRRQRAMREEDVQQERHQHTTPALLNYRGCRKSHTVDKKNNY